MKNLILATIISIFFVSCLSSEENEATIICGEVINVGEDSPKVLTVFPYDFKMNTERLSSDISQSDFKFHQKFSMTHRHDVAINYNGKFYTFMAEPSDSIFVLIDAKEKSIVFSGSKARFNTQLSSVSKVVDSKFNEIASFDLETDVEGVVAQLVQKISIIRDTLDTFSIDEGVKSYLLSNTLYCFANGLLMFDQAKDYSPERYRLLTHEIFDLYNPDQAQSFMYFIHLQNSIGDFMMSVPELREEYQKEEKDMTKLSQLMLRNTLQLPKSIMRDIQLTNIVSFLSHLSEYLSKSVTDFYDKQYLDPNNYSNPKFMELNIKPLLKIEESDEIVSISGGFDIESEMKYINNDNEIENLNDVNVVGYIKERYKGRVIYIDVWATWCVPCIEEMKHAKKLHEMYSDRDDITFVNLCLSSEVDGWVKAIEKNTIGGENYFVGSDDVAKMILSAYKLAGYPSYILIDKEGELITTSAFRPSQLDKLSEQIEEL